MRRHTLLVAVWLAVGGGPVAGQVEAIDVYLQPLDTAGELSGTVLVARGDRVIYERSFGLADYELGVPNTASTRFGVGSVTKLLTAIAAFRLAEAGTLSLDDPLSRWLADFPRSDAITVSHLLHHRSGLPHRVIPDDAVVRTYTAADMAAHAAASEPRFEPGSERGYSSAGYSVLARVLELATGRPYREVLLEQVLLPAGAVHTVDEEALYLIRGRAEDHLRGPDGPLRAPPANLSFVVGAGSVFSTARDLLAVVRTLIEGGYGELARREIVGPSGHLYWNGQTFGYRAYIDYRAADDLTVVFTGNLLTGAADLLRRALPRLAAGEAVDPPSPPAVVPVVLPDDEQRALSGTYQFRAGAPDSEETLRFAPDGRYAILGDWILIPADGDRFFLPGDYAELLVRRETDGAVQGLEWRRGEDRFFMPRVEPLP